jgi:hypothetical protein
MYHFLNENIIMLDDNIHNIIKMQRHNGKNLNKTGVLKLRGSNLDKKKGYFN